MSDKTAEYAERLSDLLEDMESDEVDPVNLMMSWIACYIEQFIDDPENEEFYWPFENKTMVIGIEDAVCEAPIARLH